MLYECFRRPLRQEKRYLIDSNVNIFIRLNSKQIWPVNNNLIIPQCRSITKPEYDMIFDSICINNYVAKAFYLRQGSRILLLRNYIVDTV